MGCLDGEKWTCRRTQAYACLNMIQHLIFYDFSMRYLKLHKKAQVRTNFFPTFREFEQNSSIQAYFLKKHELKMPDQKHVENLKHLKSLKHENEAFFNYYILKLK